jgi:maleamate amidohydrolase
MNKDEQFFKERGFGQTIGFGEKPAVLVLDMLNAFTNEKMPLGTDQSAQIKVINKLLKVARQKGIPIFFITIYYDEHDLADAGVWFRKMKGLETLKLGTYEVEIDSRIERLENEPVVRKKFASAFFGTDLLSRLINLGIDTLILMGCTTSGCVRATAVDAVQYGFRSVIVEDAVTDRSKSAHKQALFDMQTKYADVLCSNDISSKVHEL